MMVRPDWAPEGVDIDRPNVARMYDYYLGGSHNLSVDREAAEQAIAALPELPRIARVNRAFMDRAVRCCLAAGVQQFLDIGSGIPTVGNVHEVAGRLDPSARVVYVDADPVAVAHTRVLLTGNNRVAALLQDLRRPEAILNHPDLHRVLDLDRPVAVLLVAVLHFVPDAERPEDLVTRLVAPLVRGSHLVISHATAESRPDNGTPLVALYQRASSLLTARPRAVIEQYFRGLDLIHPGLVWPPQWRPSLLHDIDEPAAWCHMLAGVARKT